MKPEELLMMLKITAELQKLHYNQSQMTKLIRNE